MRRRFIIAVIVMSSLAWPPRTGGQIDNSESLSFSRFRFGRRVAPDTIVCDFESIGVQRKIFRSAGEWEAFWKKHRAKAPPVNFKRYRALAIFLGFKPSSGYAVRVEQVTFDRTKGSTIIHVREYVPDPNRNYADVATYPADVIKFPSRPGTPQFDWQTRPMRP